jgi:hypothetical protein
MATLKFSVKLHKDGTGSVIDILTGHPSYASGVILRHLPEGDARPLPTREHP